MTEDPPRRGAGPSGLRFAPLLKQGQDRLDLLRARSSLASALQCLALQLGVERISDRLDRPLVMVLDHEKRCRILLGDDDGRRAPAQRLDNPSTTIDLLEHASIRQPEHVEPVVVAVFFVQKGTRRVSAPSEPYTLMW